jgi:hypothetical protein
MIGVSFAHYTDLGLLAESRGRFLRQAQQTPAQTLADLQAAINRFLAETNENPKLFVWTADPDTIIAAFRRGYQALDSIH